MYIVRAKWRGQHFFAERKIQKKLYTPKLVRANWPSQKRNCILDQHKNEKRVRVTQKIAFGKQVCYNKKICAKVVCAKQAETKFHTGYVQKWETRQSDTRQTGIAPKRNAPNWHRVILGRAKLPRAIEKRAKLGWHHDGICSPEKIPLIIMVQSR